jgi:hypothetical protein
MNDKEIREGFEKLKINTENMRYSNAEDFAKGFKKCSVLKMVPTTYSANSQINSLTKDATQRQ